MSMWKACAFSNAARNGLFAALLAQRGLTGPAPIFEGDKGFMKLISGPFELPILGGERAPGDKAVLFRMLDTYIKHFPVEYHAQTAVEAALALRAEMTEAEGPRLVEHLSEIEIGSYDVAIEIIGRDPEKWQPTTRETADHSFPYCVAAALLDGRVTLHSFDPKRLRDPALHELMKKVRVVNQPEFAGRYPATMPTRITVRTTTGKAYVQQVDLPLGHPGNPMPDREVEDKLRRLASRRIGRPQVEKLIDFVWKLEREKDIATLMPLLKVTHRDA